MGAADEAERIMLVSWLLLAMNIKTPDVPLVEIEKSTAPICVPYCEPTVYGIKGPAMQGDIYHPVDDPLFREEK